MFGTPTPGWHRRNDAPTFAVWVWREFHTAEWRLPTDPKWCWTMGHCDNWTEHQQEELRVQVLDWCEKHLTPSRCPKGEEIDLIVRWNADQTRVIRIERKGD